MKHTVRLMIGILLVTAIVSPALAQHKRATAPPTSITAAVAADAKARLTKVYSTSDLQAGVYVGSQFCMACHKTEAATYPATQHASFVRRPLTQWTLQPGKGVIANSLGKTTDDFMNGLDFNALSGTPFDKYKPNAPKLSVENGTYFITVGSLKMPVVLTVAGQKSGSDQRFVVRVPVTDTPNGLTVSAYFGPFTYSPTKGYAVANGWYDSTTNAPKFSAGITSASLTASGGPSNHTSGCTGCHMGGATKALTKTATGETAYSGYPAVLYASDDPTVTDYNLDGNFELMNIGCESCHGPGSNHILGGGDPAKIVNPASLSVQAQSEICGRCHVTSASVPAGSYNWPLNDATNTQWTPFDAKAGTPLANFYTDKAKKWPDGVHNNGARPLNDWLQSNHATFTAHQVGCTTCHDAHVEGEGMLLRDTTVQAGLTIKVSAEDNTLCVSCHAGYGPFATFSKQDVYDMTQGKADAATKIASVTEKHTNHPYAPERIMGLSRCTGCHMSAFGHTFNVGTPAATLQYQDKGGQPNGCASGCHSSKVDVVGIGQTKASSVSTWNNSYDVTLANFLKVYYGDGGKWWDTAKK